MNEENLIPFVKGKSGNPSGRPKGVQNRATIVKRWLETNYTGESPLTKKKVRKSIEDFIVMAQISKAIYGDTQAFNALMDSAYGKPRQPIEHGSDIDLSNPANMFLEVMKEASKMRREIEQKGQDNLTAEK